MAISPIPAGYPPVIPYLIVPGVPKLIDFMTQVFGATLIGRHDAPDGSVGHAEMRIGDSVVMMGEASDKWPAIPGSVLVYLEDVDAAYRRALDAGATSVTEPTDQFYGDRSSGVKDPCGNTWWITTHIEEVSPEELSRRMKELAQRGKTAAAGSA
jgi:PhnB protein